jgi:site-specific recombinase XerD
MTSTRNTDSGTVSDWLARYPATTREAYARDIRQFTKWLTADPLTADRVAVQAWLTELARQGRKPPTIRRKASAVSSLLAYAVSEDLIPANPAAHTRRPSGGQAVRLGLTDDDTRKLLAAAQTTSRTAYALVALLVSTGVRISEACGANLESIGQDSSHATLEVRRKGGRRDRVPLPPEVLAAIRAAAGDNTAGPLFIGARGARLSRHAAAWQLRQLAAKAGIEHVYAHRLRHTAATLAIRAGYPLEKVQAMLGHASPETTQRYIKAIANLDDSPSYALARTLLGPTP